MDSNLFKQQKDFFMLGMDFNENGYHGLLGDYIQSLAQDKVEFSLNVRQDTRAQQQLISLKNLPALLKQIPDLVCGYFNQFSSVVRCDYEHKKNVFILTVTSWKEFIDQFGKTHNDKTELLTRLNKAKKL